MVESLYNGGLTDIEVTSFVHPKYVPHMADAEQVFIGTKHLADFGVLVPNQRGFDRAKEVGAEKFNVFFSSSNEFNQRNLGKNFEQVYPDLLTMLEDIDTKNVRAYISCAFGCPFEGMPKDHELKEIMVKADAIADTIVLCDTIGTAHPLRMVHTLDMTRTLDAEVALHLHERDDAHANILSNVHTAADWGGTKFDASIAGLGGCPFIPGSGSNLSTNKLINWGYDNGYDTGVELSELSEITHWLSDKSKKINKLLC